MHQLQQGRIVYIFIDESGNYDFSNSGTEYLIFTALSTVNPLRGTVEADELRHRINSDLDKYNCIDCVEYFHASEDKQLVRNAFFETISSKFEFIADVIYGCKRKAHPSLQSIEGIVTKMVPCLIDYITSRHAFEDADLFQIYTDRIPVRSKREAVEKALKTQLRLRLGKDASFCIYHVDSKSQFYLQAADYVCWSVSRKLERNDLRSYNIINSKIKSYFDFFGTGDTKYY
jgi:Protein of unknown function (DUF3800)